MAQKKSMKKALGASLKAEERAVKDRFQRADAAMGLKGETDERAPRTRVVRDSFTLPATDYELIAQVQARVLKKGVHGTKSEIIRAGLQTLAAMTDTELATTLRAVERIKTGRPATE